MNTNNDIQQLIDRFMAGQTSLEEEQQLAEYFRTNDVPTEWKAYKEMSSYFDEGMPEGRYADEKKPFATRRRIVWAVIAAAAAVALLFVMTWKHGNSTAIKTEQQPEIAAVATDTLYNNKADTASTDAQKVLTAPRKNRNSKYKYRVAPPKTYYAKAENKAKTLAKDSISPDEALIAARLKGAEIMEKMLLRKIELMETAHELEVILASNEDILDDEDMEDVY